MYVSVNLFPFDEIMLIFMPFFLIVFEIERVLRFFPLMNMCENHMITLWYTLTFALCFSDFTEIYAIAQVFIFFFVFLFCFSGAVEFFRRLSIDRSCGKTTIMIKLITSGTKMPSLSREFMPIESNGVWTKLLKTKRLMRWQSTLMHYPRCPSDTNRMNTRMVQNRRMRLYKIRTREKDLLVPPIILQIRPLMLPRRPFMLPSRIDIEVSLDGPRSIRLVDVMLGHSFATRASLLWSLLLMMMMKWLRCVPVDRKR